MMVIIFPPLSEVAAPHAVGRIILVLPAAMATDLDMPDMSLYLGDIEGDGSLTAQEAGLESAHGNTSNSRLSLTQHPHRTIDIEIYLAITPWVL